MHTEIANPDALLSRGKDEALTAFTQFRESVQNASKKEGGQVLESLHGEAIATFDTVSAAVNAALELQKSAAQKFKSKIGINVGEILFTTDGAIGNAAEIAQELMRAVPSGGICISATALHSLPVVKNRTIPLRLELPDGEKIEAFRLEEAGGEDSDNSRTNSPPESSHRENTDTSRATDTSGAMPSIESIKREIFEQIKQTGRRPSEEEVWAAFSKYGQAAWEVISKLGEAGIIRDAHVHHSHHHQRHEYHDDISIRIEEKINRKVSGKFSTDEFASYRAELSKTANRLKSSILPSIISFLGVNGLLWYINLTYIADSKQILWAAPVTAMWFFGLLRKFVRVGQSRRISDEAAGIVSLDANQLKEYKGINRERTKFLSRFFSFFSLSSLLLCINLFSDPKNPWFLIPTAFLALSLVAHSIKYKAQMPGRIRRFFESLGPTPKADSTGGGKAVDVASLGPYAEAYAQAAKDAGACLAVLKKISPEEMPEAEKSVKTGMEQVLLLASTLNELDGLIASMPLAELKKDRATLEAKKQTASSSLAIEYDRNITEIDAQLKAHASLLERKEGLETKLHSMSNQFRQLSLDLASAHVVDAQSKLGDQHAALEKLGKKAEEIRLSIEDMNPGSDDWLSAEIEKISKEKLSMEKA